MTHIKRALPTFAMLVCVGLTSYLYGFSDASGGSLPWFQASEYILPPEPVEQTSQEVACFVEEDATDEQPYDEGFNCIDYALAVSRAASWKGIETEIVRVDYATPPSHAVIAFPTTDRGVVFYETQTDHEVQLSVGKVYNGRVVTSLSVMRIVWVPLEDWSNGD